MVFLPGGRSTMAGFGFRNETTVATEYFVQTETSSQPENRKKQLLSAAIPPPYNSIISPEQAQTIPSSKKKENTRSPKRGNLPRSFFPVIS